MVASSTPRKRGCCAPAKIKSKLRYSTESALELTAEEVIFGRAMHKYLAEWKRINPTCGEILDVAMSLGYFNGERDFKKAVDDFTAAVHRFKVTKKRPHPLWSEILSILAQLGYQRRPAPAGEAAAEAAGESAADGQNAA